MKKYKILFTITLLTFLMMPAFSIAEESKNTNKSTDDGRLIRADLITNTAKDAGFSTKKDEDFSATISENVGTIVSILLSFVGAIFFLLIIFSGIQWMTAGGNDDKVSKAKTRVINASIGLTITVAAYFITWFIGTALLGN